MVNPPEAGLILRGSGPLSYLAYEDSQRIRQPTRRSRSRTLSAPVRGKRLLPEGLPIRERVGEPQRAEGISGNRHLPDVAGVQDREHGKLPTG
jgi:hypothetical protein